jgi:ParB/RepB/Spo0J family partition protein
MSLTETAGIDVATAPAGTPPSTPSALFQRVSLELIVPSRWNRTTFDQAKLQELADSIARLGVMQPILVRPLPGERVPETSEFLGRGDRRPEFEIVSGERRWRASELAGVADIPAVIRAMSDQEVLEAQLVENLQREDLHPLAEAEGYQRLCEITGIKKEQIAEKIGKGRTYVYNRLKLLDLSEASREAFRAGKLDTSRAELLATIADTKQQAKALKEFTEEGYGGRTKSVRECRDWLQQNVLLKLDHAPFSIKDAKLCPEAGACTECPKRTHHDRDLFAAFDGPDMCIDPPCFHAKEAAHIEKIRANAAEKGMDVIAGKEAKALKPSSWSEIKGYTKIDTKVRTPDGEVPVRKAIGKDGPKPVLFVDPHTKEPIQVVPTAALEQALKKKGLLKATRDDERKRDQAEAAKAKVAREIEALWRRRATDKILAAARTGTINSFSAPVLRLVLLELVESEAIYDRQDEMLSLCSLPEDVEAYDAVPAHVRAAPDNELGPLVLAFLLAGCLSDTKHRYDNQDGDAPLTALASEIGLDLGKLQAEAKEEVKAAHAEERARQRPKNKGGDSSEAAPPGATPEAAPQGSDARTGDKRRKGGANRPAGGAAKLTAEEANSGIADAMQNMEGPAGAAGEPGGEDAAALDKRTPEGLNHELPGLGGQASGWPDFAAAPFGIEAGKTVRVLDTVSNPQLKKWVGKEGTVLSRIGDSAFDVSFKLPKGGKVLAFDKTELEVVQA